MAHCGPQQLRLLTVHGRGQVLQDLTAKDVEELAAEEDAWLLAFFQGAPPDPAFLQLGCLRWRVSPLAHKR